MTELGTTAIQPIAGNDVDDAINGALHQLVAGNGWADTEATDFLRRVTAPLIERLETRRQRLVKADADLAESRIALAGEKARNAAAGADLHQIRALLTPAGVVPMELGATLAPAVHWLVGRKDYLGELLATPPVRTVAGECPMGCGTTLYLTHDDQIACSAGDCGRPRAAAEILTDGETAHIVHLGPYDFSLQHPLAERLDGRILTCRVNRAISTAGSPPQPIGSYRVVPTASGLEWTPMVPKTITTHRAEPDGDRG